MNNVSTPKWDILLAPINGDDDVLLDLTTATNRKLNVSLNDASSFSFDMSGFSSEVELIRELASDIIVYRDGVKLFRGRVGGSSDSIDETGHSISFSVWDYREMLNRRVLLGSETMEWLGVDQEQIAWDLISDSQNKDGGDLGITRGTKQSTSVLRDISYDAGTSVGEALQKLSELQNGFDWEISPDMEFKVYYPLRGDQNSKYVLDYGGSVASLSRKVDPSQYANVIRLQGGTPELPDPPNLNWYYPVNDGGYFGLNEEYRYAVSAILPEGETKVSETREVKITRSTQNAVYLRWYSVPRATGYNVYGRNRNKGPNNVSVEVSTDYTGVFEVGRQLKFGVSALTPYGESDVTEANFTIPDTVTTNNNAVYITWYPVPGATGYKVYGRDQNDSLRLIQTKAANVTWDTDTGTVPLQSEGPPEPFPMQRIATNVKTTSWTDTGVSWPYGDLPTGETQILSQIQSSGDFISSGTGRIESNISDQGLLRQSTVDDRSMWYLNERSTVRPSYDLTLAPGRWSGPDDLWLGDRPVLDIVSGRLNVNTRDLRVTEMSFNIDESGAETIEITIGYRPQNIFEKVHTYETRINQISRY